MAIASSTALSPSMNAVLDETLHTLDADAAAVLRRLAESNVLEYVADRKFKSPSPTGMQIHLGEGIAGRVAAESPKLRCVSIEPGSEEDEVLSDLFPADHFSFCAAAPLFCSGDLMGVLEVFRHDEFSPDREWRDFLQTLAKHAGIAMHHIGLFEDLQQSHTELVRAYDETIEGWSKALELRDQETEGHTQRVTHGTLRLAAEWGIPEKRIVHIRRGALLHDIGKMGIPDRILRKEGELTDKEWEMMRKHPLIAYDMLSSIEYLKPALDIPYCHHERWDGTGYPRGLQAEEIPLAARLFAIVDVWDALSSDRPYRAPLPEEKVREHIRRGMGSHFDPRAANTFLRMDWDTLRDGVQPKW
jgi:HD-GYP domain-containing protein (c-di-GMP phosphodiesterase class II)